MSKRTHKSGHKDSSRPSFPWSRQPKLDMEATIMEVTTLLESARADEAIARLQSLIARYPRESELYYYAGFVYIHTGDVYAAADSYERAAALSNQPEYWLALVAIYVSLDMRAHALFAMNKVGHRLELPAELNELSATLEAIKQDIATLGRHLGIMQSQAEQGLRSYEEGTHAAQMVDYQTAANSFRRAAKLLNNWPSALNALALALFYIGQHAEAIKSIRTALAAAPHDVETLNHAIRILTWSGQATEARTLWAQLQAIPPVSSIDRLTQATAAAILEDDATVYQLLKPLDHANVDLPLDSIDQTQYFLAIAEANTGRGRAAQSRLRRLGEAFPAADDVVQALRAKQPGLGWAPRYPYFRAFDLMPGVGFEELGVQLEQTSQRSATRIHEEMARFLKRYPQTPLVARKLLWEEKHMREGVAILMAIGTPETYAAVREYVFSQAGDDALRIQALQWLQEEHQVAQDELVRLWIKGQWQEVRTSQFTLSTEAPAYSPQVVKLLEQGINAMHREDYRSAERAFRDALKLEPRAKDAYNNLASLYSIQGDATQADAMLAAALEIDPLYVHARCNLALRRLDAGDLQAAKDALAPLAEVTNFHPQALSYYYVTQAKIHMHEEEYEAARAALETALNLDPDNEAAEKLFAHLNLLSLTSMTFNDYFKRQQDRNLAKRKATRGKLTTTEVKVADALGLYSREALTAMARTIISYGGWSTLRKVELLDGVIKELLDEHNLERILKQLTQDEQAALRTLLALGGAMPWEKFAAQYDDDLEESPYWQYHEPHTLMGRLRLRGLLAEAVVAKETLIFIPTDLRPALRAILGASAPGA